MSNNEVVGSNNKSYPLRELVSCMQTVADTVTSSNPHINVAQFVQACRLFPLREFGLQFVFVYTEVIDKVKRVETGTTPGETIKELFEKEIAQGSAKTDFSRSRNVIRLKRAIDMVRIFFEQILADQKSESIYGPITKAYDQAFEYHVHRSKGAVQATLQGYFPNKSTFMKVLNETENSINEPFVNFIAAAKVVASHIESIFQAEELGEELLLLILFSVAVRRM